MTAKIDISSIESRTIEQNSLSVIVPVHNEEETLPVFHEKLSAVLDELECQTEILYINDGSTDHSSLLINTWQQNDTRVGLLDLSRNFGKEAAMSAGLDHCKGDAVIIIDSDLQDPPELIPQLVAKWQQGFEVVYATRTERDGESWLRKFTTHLFYRLLHKTASVDIPKDTGDFRLLSRRAVDALKQLNEQHRFMKGLFSWIGFAQTGVPYRRDPRYAGKSKWNYWRLWNFALEGITSFTTAPLKIATYFGLITAGAAFLLGLYIIIDTLLYGNPIPGYPSLMVVVLFLGGSQLVAIGVLGEYLGRMFDEVKGRPLYLIKSYHPPAEFLTDEHVDR